MIYMDFETRSECDLKKTGSYVYARHESTDILCLRFTWDDCPDVGLWHPGFEDLAYLQAQKKADRTREDIPRPADPTELWERILLGDEVEAHSAFFERNIWDAIMVERYDFPAVDFDQWRCSAAVAASFGMRRKLEHVASDLRLTEQKDMPGHRLMLKLAKPRKPTKRDPDSKWHQRRDELLWVFEYCAQDVRTERELSNALRPLKGTELELWKLDQKINLRGLHLDRKLVEGALKIGAAAEATAQVQLQAITNGAVEKTTKRAQFKEWLRAEGVTIPTKLAKQIEDDGTEHMVVKETTGADYLRPLLEDCGLAENVCQAIEIWLAVNKTSTKKYLAMFMRMLADDRVREILRYWGATTGRWGGMGIQPQNLPRNCPKAAEMHRICHDIHGADYDDVCMLYGAENIMALLSRILRGAITAAPGYDLISADYSAVEARGTFWIAGLKDGLDDFRRLDAMGAGAREDIYTSQASMILGRRIYKSDEYERQVWGKVPVLACGYQGGVGALQNYASIYGVDIDDAKAQEIVDGYREANYPVKEFWYEADRCAVEAVRRGPGKPAVEMSNGRIKFKRLGVFLHLRLPNGRLLSYFNPRLEMDERFGKVKVVFTGYATYKPGLWTNVSTYGGKLTENIVQALCRDIMAEAMLRAEAAGYPIVLTVHDEIVSEILKGEGDLAEFESLLSVVPDWADGFPIVAEGWRRERYGK